MKVKRSPINYMGGKYRSMNFILPKIPDNITTFYDVFAGSGTVALNVKAREYVLNDKTTPLVKLHKYLITNKYEDIYENILEDVSRYGLSDPEGKGFLKLRDDYNKDKSPRKLYALTQHSFNYLMRFNKKGEFNASFGKGVCKLGDNALIKLRGYNEHFNTRNTSVLNKDFREFLKDANIRRGDYVYFDPPYEQTLANYNENRGYTGWSKEDANDVRSALVELDGRGIYFGYSNVIISKGVVNKELLDFLKETNFKMYSKTGYISGVPSTRTHRGKDVEVFITNYETPYFEEGLNEL